MFYLSSFATGIFFYIQLLYPHAKCYTISSININTTDIFQFLVIFAQIFAYFILKILKRPMTAGLYPILVV